MKVYNKQKGRFIALWNKDGALYKEDKKDESGRIVQKAAEPVQPLTERFVIEGSKQSAELPTELAEYLVKKFPHKLTADSEQMAEAQATAKKLEEQAQKIADLENEKNRLVLLMTAAASSDNPKAAAAAAEELDAILGLSKSRGRKKKAPAATPESGTDEEASPPAGEAEEIKA